ncbi:hypothetical protein D3C87_1796850 [compost metagenome]
MIALHRQACCAIKDQLLGILVAIHPRRYGQGLGLLGFFGKMTHAAFLLDAANWNS